MNRRMQLMRAVALQADGLYERSTEFGQQAARDISGERARSQITGLEAIVASTLKVSDVLDYIKRQTARHEEWRTTGLGSSLLQFMTGELYTRRDAIAAQLAPTSDQEKQLITLMLYREFIRQLSAHDAFVRSGTSRS